MFRVLLTVTILITLPACLFGCGSADCLEYVQMLNDKDEKFNVLIWGRENILGAKFKDDDLTEGWLVGPGNFAVRREALKNFPSTLNHNTHAEIRLLGLDSFEPSGYFIGNDSYRGVIVADKSLDHILAAEDIPTQEIIFRDDNVAVICRQRY